jgi:hypothetical protein
MTVRRKLWELVDGFCPALAGAELVERLATRDGCEPRLDVAVRRQVGKGAQGGEEGL